MVTYADTIEHSGALSTLVEISLSRQARAGQAERVEVVAAVRDVDVECSEDA